MRRGDATPYDILKARKDLRIRVPDLLIAAIWITGSQEVVNLARVQATAEQVMRHLQVGHGGDFLYCHVE